MGSGHNDMFPWVKNLFGSRTSQEPSDELIRQRVLEAYLKSPEPSDALGRLMRQRIIEAYSKPIDTSHSEESAHSSDEPELQPKLKAKKRCIVLVHGTWARGLIRAFIPSWSRIFGKGSYWFDRGSDFCEQLYKAQGDDVDVDIATFDWSGNNSVLDRAAAASELAAYLTSAMETQPGAQHVVIAHSHGGNVALRAMEYLGRERASRFLIVTLATPFIQLYRSYLSSQYLLASVIIYLGISLGVSVKVLPIVLECLFKPGCMEYVLFHSSGGSAQALYGRYIHPVYFCLRSSQSID
jgi:Alpha/beta hydrolase family